jgi:hypothetical protein
MIHTASRRSFCLCLFSSLVLIASHSARAQWTIPTPEELSMTSQPEVPGAAAVYLFREEVDDDQVHMSSSYIRLKVLNERGKEYADVELPYAKGENGYSVDDIQGRTIHPDGTIIPFMGKPYQKLVEKTQGAKLMAKVFTLPDVEIGSIIEYRFKRHYDGNVSFQPQWYLQSDLWTRKGHYLWRTVPNGRISWTAILPVGAAITQSKVSFYSGLADVELNVHDIPSAPNEDFMPPINSFTYRVLFYYFLYNSPDEFWKNEGKLWAEAHNKFIGPGHLVSDSVKELTAPSDTQDQKLRKIYAAVMKLENTSYTREHSSSEEKAEGLKEVRTTDDIWARKRGSNKQLTRLFIAMARAAGMKAYLVAVTNRDLNIFDKNYPSFSQVDDYLAIVNVDGKEQFFDPGSRYCPYGHLAWKHTLASGLRQNDEGSEMVTAPSEPYTYSRTQRMADLTIDQKGNVTGTIKVTFMGSPALFWRQRSLIGDAASLERELRSSVEKLIPQGMEINAASIGGVPDYESPLTIKFEVGGILGSSTGKRLLIPGDLFEANTKPSFPHEKRDIAVAFSYPHLVQDAVRIGFPTTLKIESTPVNDKIVFQTSAGYDMKMESTPTSVIMRRNYALGGIFYAPRDYAGLRTFYSKMENKDQEAIVLTTAPTAAKPTPTGN